MAFRWLLKMSQWARNPPSEKRVKLVFGVILACLLLVGMEKLDLWPEWATLDKKSLRELPRATGSP